jgi:hypothetical protein
MAEIRKIAVGPDYKSGAMHYIIGQWVLNNHYKIEHIRFDDTCQSFKIYITNEVNETLLWKEFTKDMPISIEYNIDF